VLGDESGYTTGEVQKVKLAAIEAEWETEPPPASFTAFGFPDQAAEKTHFAIKIPWLTGLVATRSIDTPVVGIKELKREHEQRIRNGIKAYAALQKLKSGDRSAEALAAFDERKADLGYALLLRKYAPNVVDATDEQIGAAVADTIPHVATLFWSFRVMVGISVWLLFLFGSAFLVLARRRLAHNRWVMRLAILSVPLPWVAAELGWIVAEYGRQPWTISEVLPTYLSTSTVTVAQVGFSLAGFVFFYTGLLVADVYLMVKYARLGPASLGTGRYHDEAGAALRRRGLAPGGPGHA